MGRLAVDIGGTFTDLVHFDGVTGRLTVDKALTTPHDLTEGVVEAMRFAKLSPEAIGFFVHGGTTVINTITERKGAKTALVTTKGFRDVLEIGRGNRPDLYNIRVRKPEPFVSRRYRFEVGERTDASGREIEPLRLRDLDPIVERCREEEIEAIAVQFLHSYAAPAHEAKAAAVLRERLPGVAITASHEITREWREYERANSAVLNAYVQPIVQRYFATLERVLRDQGLNCPFFAMQSNGGTTSFGWAKEHPIALLESGPAAGVNGAVLVGELTGEPNLLYLDIGGTTAKCSVIEGGQAKVTTDYKLEWSRINPGYPVKVPVVDIVEIGAGGGSIAWFDAAGALRIGPVSAGADPGPASYDRGGTEATVTDAKLVTGVLDPAYFAGGRLPLDPRRAFSALTPIAHRLGVSIDAAAVAIIRLVDANMVNALKLVSIQRGHDPRDFVLTVGGGGGPMHAATLGREIGVREIIVPRHPGCFSAWGMLATQPRRDFVLTRLKRAEAITLAEIRDLFSELEREARDYFGADAGLRDESLSFEQRIDLRYLGQEHCVTVQVTLDAASIATILADFHDAHERAYTFRLEDTPVEFVNFRLTARAEVASPRLERITNEARSVERAAKAPRFVEFGEAGRYQTQVFERDWLPAGFEASGPLIVEEAASTTVVLPDQCLLVDDYGFLRIRQR